MEEIVVREVTSAGIPGELMELMVYQKDFLLWM